MTRITAIIIQSRGDDIRCQAGGPAKDNGKYVGWITLYRGDEYDHELVSTEPIFNTEKDAVAHMEDLVKEVRAMDLDIPPVVKEAVDITHKIKNSI